jgi:O-glycosyl hydrolase
MQPWGNLRGIRIEGQLVPFETSLRQYAPDGTLQVRSEHYAVAPGLTRNGQELKVDTQVGIFHASKSVHDQGNHEAEVELRIEAAEDGQIGELSLTFEWPVSETAPGSISWQNAATGAGRFEWQANNLQSVPVLPAAVDVISLESAGHTLRIQAPQGSRVIPSLGTHRATNQTLLELRFPIASGIVRKAQIHEARFSLSASTQLDTTNAELQLNPEITGRPWLGLGGNFRLQFPETDPQVIDYCLDNLEIPWTRIAMWWQDWEPEEGVNPFNQPDKAKATDRIEAQLALAKRLADHGGAVMIGAWFPPQWAISDETPPAGTYGHLLNPDKYARVADSIADYLAYFKSKVGVDALLFSFNEPDIGVQVVQNPAMHIELMKAIVAAARERGLSTRYLLADTSNGTPYSISFAEAALADESVRGEIIGGVGFHTWGGTETENLERWSALANQLEVPLFVSEGGMDSEAHRSPALFLEPAYQLDESALYVRLMAEAQAQSIMHWQLTADYSILDGGNTYGREGPLKETMRFDLIKQLGMTPNGAQWIQIGSNRSDVICAAYATEDQVALHVVNTGAARKVRLSGLPSGLEPWASSVTTPETPRQGIEKLQLGDGTLEWDMPACAFATLLLGKAN